MGSGCGKEQQEEPPLPNGNWHEEAELGCAAAVAVGGAIDRKQGRREDRFLPSLCT